MIALIHVCVWCNRVIDESGTPGETYALDCTNSTVSHGACNECRPEVEDEIAAFKQKVKERKEKVLCR
jgi:hypothetical protein